MPAREFFVGDVHIGDFVSDAAYAELRRDCVLATVDVMPVRNGSEIYLGHRAGTAQAGYWWIFGGRMNAGETFAQTANRVLARELAIQDADEERLRLLGYYSLYWNLDGQIDHALLAAHSYDVASDTELPVPDYHSEAKWFAFEEVATRDFHPCIAQMVADYRLGAPGLV